MPYDYSLFQAVLSKIAVKPENNGSFAENLIQSLKAGLQRRIGYSLEGNTSGVLEGSVASGGRAYREGTSGRAGRVLSWRGGRRRRRADCGKCRGRKAKRRWRRKGRRYKNEGGERQKARWRSKFAAREERPGEIHRATSAGRGGATEDEAPHASPLSACGASHLPKFSTGV